jgi:hypothetical protein
MVRFGDGCSLTLDVSAGESRAAAPSLKVLQASLNRSKSENDITVVATRAASSRFSGEHHATHCAASTKGEAGGFF